MFRQALSLLTYRKKSTALMILLMGFVFFLMGSVPALFSEQDHIWFQAEAGFRGAFDGIFFDLSARQRESLFSGGKIQSGGLISHYGAYEVSETGREITLGSMDKTAIQLGRIDAVEGRLPQTAGEIALEEMWRARLPKGTGIGSTLHIQTAGGEKAYTLCGFIENYTEAWAEGLNVNPSIKNLPHALIGEGGAPGGVVQTDALISFQRLGEMEDTSRFLDDLQRSLELDTEQVSFNELLYNRVPPDYRTFQSVFIMAILAGVVTVSYISLSYYVESYGEVARKLFINGAREKDTLRLLLVWTGLLAAGALVLDAAFHALFSALTQQNLGVGIDIPLWNARWAILLALFGLFSLTIWFHKRKIEPLKDLSLSEQREETAIRTIALKRHIDGSFAAARAQGGRKRLWGAYVSIAVILGLFLCVQEDVNSRLGLNFHHGQFSFTLLQRHLAKGEVTTFGDFIFDSGKSGVTFEQMDELRALPGIKSVDMKHCYGMHPSLLLKDRNSAYARVLYEQDANEYREKTAPDIPKDAWATVMDYGSFHVIVLDEKKLETFLAEYPEVSREDLALGSAVLYCPPLETELGVTVENDLFREGGEISFGWLESEAAFEEAVENPSLIDYREESFSVTRILAKSENSDWPAGGIIVLLSEETVRNTDVFSKISFLSVNVDMSITEKNYSAIQNRLTEMVRDSFAM